MNIAFIGLGHMGLPMAKNLLSKNEQVRGFDLSPAALTEFAAAGGVVAHNAAAAAQGADIVISMLPAGQHVRDTYLGAGAVLPALGKNALVIDCSTIDVETARFMASQCLAQQLGFIDAPVSGGTAGAAAGTLTFMVGGSAENFQKAEPILQKMGKTIIHAGEAGAGQAAKICNNMLLAISMIGVSEAFVLAEKLGLAADILFKISSQSSGQCWSLNSYCPWPGLVPTAPSNRDYAPGFSSAMMLKDLRLAQEAAQSVQAATPLGAQATALYTRMVEQGLSGKDFSAVITWLREQA